MKNLFTRMSAALLVLWYCLSIIGFDVHTCHDTGCSSVNLSFTAYTCDDIHDHHHEDDHHHDKGCCDDDYQVISLTGLRSDDDSEHYDLLAGADLLYMVASGTETVQFDRYASNLEYVSEPDSGLIVHDARSFFCVWLI